MTDTEGLFAKAVQGALDLGEECIIVHGGGPQIDAALKATNVQPEYIGGFTECFCGSPTSSWRRGSSKCGCATAQRWT
jgi:hypothetical protein